MSRNRRYGKRYIDFEAGCWITATLLDKPSLHDYNEPRSIVGPKSSIERGEARVTKVIIDDNESFDSLLRRFNKKVQRDRILSEARRRRFFEKPSVVRKRKKAAKLRKSRRQTYRDQQSRY
jgi:small subunit ribosomal protein S21